MEKIYSKEGNKEQDEKLLFPYYYTLQMPGKKFRTKLINTFNFWLKVPQEKVDKIATIIESLHNASLIIDDIEDNSTLRRGLPVAHSIFSMKRSINSAQYLTYLITQISLDMDKKLMPIYAHQMLELHRGQGMDIYWRDNFICPTEEEYCLMTKRKTGGLFVLAMELMQFYSETEYDFRILVENLGLYFQIKDDYINLTSEEYMKDKSFCDDLSEGKFSFPIIHAIHLNGEVLEILRGRPTDDEVKKHCVDLIEKSGSFEYTRKKLDSLRQIILDEFKNIDEGMYSNPHVDMLLEKLFNLK